MHQTVQMVQVTHYRHDCVHIMLKMYTNNSSLWKVKISKHNLSAIDTLPN